MIELRIQGEVVEAERGESLLAVARRAGFDVPSLCYHEALEPYGACRVCLVEVASSGRAPRLTTSCNFPALPDLEVTLDTERVTRARRVALELLLAHAPEAPVVRSLAERYGVMQSRFDRVEQPRDCILCGLCDQACRTIVGASAISLAGRGGTRRVEVPFGDPEACIGCGTCDVLCPTGVLHMRQDAAERMRRLPGEDRLCRYSLMGLRPSALCANGYRCEVCETEHEMVAAAGGHPLLVGAPSDEGRAG